MLDLKRILSNKNAVAVAPVSASEEELRSELARVQADLTRAYANDDHRAIGLLRESREILLADLKNLEEERALRDEAERLRSAEEVQRLAQAEAERMDSLKQQVAAAGEKLEGAARSVHVAWLELDRINSELTASSNELTRLKGKRGRNQDVGAPALTRLPASFLGAAEHLSNETAAIGEYRTFLGDADSPEKAHLAQFRRSAEKPLLFQIGKEPREGHVSSNEALEALREEIVVQGPRHRWP